MTVSVKRGFKKDFDLVVEYYGFTAEEIEEAKAAVRGDLEDAQVCYSTIAEEIRQEVGNEQDEAMPCRRVPGD